MLKINEIAGHFVGLFYPNICEVCGQNLVKGEEVICLDCLQKMPRTGLHNEKDNFLEQRFWGKAEIERATAFYFFNKKSNFQKILHKLKYKDGKEIGRVLGKYAAAEISDNEHFKHFDYLVPVPLHPKKLRKRGYNQALCIAQGLAEVLKTEIDAENLVRVIENPTQTKKSAYERWENTNGIFAVKSSQLFENKRVLLIDDVLTTGSTLIACAQAIHKVCNAKISVFTLAAA
ncbi:MAG: ComF family protein [Prevotellaceae bacterium]|jgi:ComF family protein|nr:ComF family protein [Prevotellaceae bacterium]